MNTLLLKRRGLMGGKNGVPIPPNNEIWYKTTDGISLNLGRAYNTKKNGYFVAGFSSDIVTGIDLQFRRTLKEIIYPFSFRQFTYPDLYTCSELELVLGLDNLETLWSQTFQGCEKLSNINNGNLGNVTTLKEQVFARTNSPHLDFSKITKFEGQTFRSTNWNYDLIFPNVETIEAGYIFYSASFPSVSFPKLKTAPAHTFAQCNIPIIKLPAIEDIPERMFEGRSTKTIYLGEVIPTCSNDRYAFNGVSIPAIYVPFSKVNAYKADSFWSQYANIIQGY